MIISVDFDGTIVHDAYPLVGAMKVLAKDVMDGWKNLIGENLIIVPDHRDVPKIITETIAKRIKEFKPTTEVLSSDKPHKHNLL
jgi:hypothetical protein